MLYINESLESRIIRHFVVDAIRSNRIIGNVFHVRISEVESGVEEGSGDGVYIRVLFPLNLMQLANEFFVMLE